jgi:hypothetical protein
VGNPQTLATGEASGGCQRCLSADSRAWDPLFLDPFLASHSFVLSGLPFEGKKLVPEANAPSHLWLVTEKIGKDGREENQEQYDWDLGSAEKCRSRFRTFRQAHNKLVQEQGTSTHSHVVCPVPGILTRPKQAS